MTDSDWQEQGTILVTGATGNVGREVILQLQAPGLEPIAAISRPERAAALTEPQPLWRVLDFNDPSTFPGAFTGVDRLFLMRPPQMANPQREIAPLLHYAVEQGVRHVVFLSLLGVEGNRFVPHAKIETMIQEAGLPYTFLRAGFFMQNLSTTHRAEIRDENQIFIPAGQGKTAFIDAVDIAAVAAAALTQPGHANRAYPLTGNEALDYQEVATLFSEILGRTIRYANPWPWTFAWRRWRNGDPLGYVGVVTAIYLTTRFGLAERVTPDVEQLLGRPPRSLRHFITDHVQLWQPTD